MEEETIRDDGCSKHQQVDQSEHSGLSNRGKQAQAAEAEPRQQSDLASKKYGSSIINRWLMTLVDLMRNLLSDQDVNTIVTAKCWLVLTNPDNTESKIILACAVKIRSVGL